MDATNKSYTPSTLPTLWPGKSLDSKPSQLKTKTQKMFTLENR